MPKFTVFTDTLKKKKSKYVSVCFHKSSLFVFPVYRSYKWINQFLSENFEALNFKERFIIRPKTKSEKKTITDLRHLACSLVIMKINFPPTNIKGYYWYGA